MPPSTQNTGLIVAAVVPATLGASIVVYMTITDAGKADLAEIIRKSAFNYLQTAALAAAFSVLATSCGDAVRDPGSLLHRR